MNIETIISYLDDETTYQSNWADGKIKTAFDRYAENYLEYAKQDLQNPFPYGTVNALSNVKRALNYQIDRILKLLGYYHKKSKTFGKDYLEKVAIIEAYNITVPKQLQVVNQARNSLEHYHRLPQPDTVKDFVTLVEAFIRETSFYTLAFPVYIEYGNSVKQEEYGFYSLTLYLNQGEPSIGLNDGNEGLNVKGNDEIYPEILKRHIYRTDQHRLRMAAKFF